jgi:hypothetical protein
MKPVPLSQLPPVEQAQFAHMLYDSMADYAGKCMKTRDALIQWIEGDK